MSFRFPRQFGERLGLAVGGLDGVNEINTADSPLLRL